MRILLATWEDDQFGPMMLEIERVSSLEEVISAQASSCYCLYKTELRFDEASDIMFKNNAYGDDLSEHKIYFLHEGTDFSTWQEDDQNELIEAAGILMKLRQNDQTKHFDELVTNDYNSLRECNMLKFFYPFAQGDSYLADLGRYKELKREQEAEPEEVFEQNAIVSTKEPHCPPSVQLQAKPRKQLHELNKTEHKALISAGLLTEVYPNATGNYEADTCRKKIVKMYAHGDKSSALEQGVQLGLTGEALNEFSGALYEVEFQVEVNLDTGENKIVGCNGTMF